VCVCVRARQALEACDGPRVSSANRTGNESVAEPAVVCGNRGETAAR
jgi:hypothetical protein